MPKGLSPEPRELVRGHRKLSSQEFCFPSAGLQLLPFIYGSWPLSIHSGLAWLHWGLADEQGGPGCSQRWARGWAGLCGQAPGPRGPGGTPKTQPCSCLWHHAAVPRHGRPEQGLLRPTVHTGKSLLRSGRSQPLNKGQGRAKEPRQPHPAAAPTRCRGREPHQFWGSLGLPHPSAESGFPGLGLPFSVSPRPNCLGLLFEIKQKSGGRNSSLINLKWPAGRAGRGTGLPRAPAIWEPREDFKSSLESWTHTGGMAGVPSLPL